MKIKIPRSEHQTVCRLFKDERHTIDRLARDYRVSTTCIERILRKNGCRRSQRIHAVDERYFATIDAADKAYFLGLLFADGCNRGNVVALSLQEGDGYLVEAFKMAVKSEAPLHIIPRKKPHHKLRVGADICSVRMCEDLSALGCVQAKSLILPFPSRVPHALMSHFLRGYFDGDGSVFSSSDRAVAVCITSSPDFCDGLQRFLRDSLGLRSNVYGYPHSKAKSVRLSSRASLVFMDYIYTNASVKMARKFDKFIDGLINTDPRSDCGSDISNERINEIKDRWVDRERQTQGLAKRPRRKDATSRLYGVEKIGESIKAVCKRHYIGQFSTEESAARAYDVYCIQNGLTRFPLNFPSDTAEQSAALAEAGRLRAGSPEQRARIGQSNRKTEVERYGAEEAARRTLARAGKRKGIPRGPLVPVIVNGVGYRSMSAAAKALGLSAGTVKRRFVLGLGSRPIQFVPIAQTSAA